MLSMPMVALLIMTSDWLFLLVLGSKWTGAAPIFTLLGIVGLVQPVTSATGWLFIAQDRTDEKLRWGVIGSVITLASFVAGLPWGAEGIAAWYSLSGLFLRAPLLFWYVGRRGPVRAKDLYSVFKIPGMAAVLTFFSLGIFRWARMISSPLANLLLTVLVAIGASLVVYLFSQRAISNFRESYRLLV